MKVNEIFLSIQGESTYAGLPTVFVRVQGCNLRCVYCDSTYAYYEGCEMSLEDIIKEIKKLGYKRVCLTGGEPMLKEEIGKLLELLADYDVTIETNGSIPLDEIKLQPNHHFVMDMKTPSSGFSDKMYFQNFKYLNELDEIKFVIADRIDYEWAGEIISRYYTKGIILFSAVFGKIEKSLIVEWILEDKIDVRFQLQMHKYIWDPTKRGV
jgi:7-carboxy-7-deazaguanine synthase